MKAKTKNQESFEELEKLAHDISDIKPLSPAMRREWEAAQRTGLKMRSARKYPNLKSRIVPISMDPKLLAAIDKFAKSAGVTRSRLVAEGLALRMKV